MSKQNELSLMAHPDYAAAWHRLQELNGEHDEIDKYITSIHARLDPHEHANTLKDKKVQAILEGKNPDHIKSEDYRNSLDKSYERQQLVRAAIEKQSEIIAQERIIFSKEIVKKVGPKYTDIVKRLALQYIALAEIIVEEINLREALNDEAIAYQSAGLRPMPLKFGDDPREDSSRFAIWIKECVEYGFIKESEVPKMFRDSWRKRGGFEFKNTALAAIVAS